MELLSSSSSSSLYRPLPLAGLSSSKRAALRAAAFSSLVGGRAGRALTGFDFFCVDVGLLGDCEGPGLGEGRDLVATWKSAIFDQCRRGIGTA